MNTRLKLIAACGLTALGASALHAAQPDPAANYPTKPVRFICPFAPGAGTDLTARTIAQKLGEKYGQQFVVDNRTGAGAATNPGLPYDMQRDLQGISQATSLFYVVYTHPTVPVKNVKELIAYAKAN